MYIFSNSRSKCIQPKETFTVFQNCVEDWIEKKSSMGPIMLAGPCQLFSSCPPAVGTNWGFKVKLWIISLSVMQQVMETVMRRLKLTAAENTWRWCGSNGIPSWTAELLLSLCWKKLRRFLNGDMGGTDEGIRWRNTGWRGRGGEYAVTQILH